MILLLIPLLFLAIYFILVIHDKINPSKTKEGIKKSTQNSAYEEHIGSIEEAHQHWLKYDEPRYRDYKGRPRSREYARDWKHRREEVFRRANGKCSSCGVEVDFVGTEKDARIQEDLYGLERLVLLHGEFDE